MSSNSDRPIEKQLREQAARRKSQADRGSFALHPVTRNVLQVEVEREFGRRQPAARWVAWWPRLAFAGGGLLALVILFVALRPDGERLELARMDSTEGKEEPTLPEPIIDDPTAGRAATASAVVAESIPPPAVAGASREIVFRFAPAALPVTGSPPALSMAPPVSVSDSIAPTPMPRQPLAEPASRQATAPVAKASPPPVGARRMATAVVAAPLQGEFDVRIVDDIITIVDADSSSYRGRLIAIDPGGTGADIPAFTDAATGEAIDSSDPRFTEWYRRYRANSSKGDGRSLQEVPLAAQFTVIGTNRSSLLSVVFSGRFLRRVYPQQAQVSVADPQPGDGGDYFQIKGTALVGSEASFSVDASTAPQ